MYDAINKGLKLATGDVIGLMHSDDEFYDENAVSKIAAHFNLDSTIEGIYGDGIYSQVFPYLLFLLVKNCINII